MVRFFVCVFYHKLLKRKKNEMSNGESLMDSSNLPSTDLPRSPFWVPEAQSQTPEKALDWASVPP